MDTSFLTIPNKNIVNNRISNMRLRKSRRIQFILGLTYDTPPNVIEKICSEIKTFGQNHPECNNTPVVTFYNFGSYALEIWVEIFLVYKSWEPYMFDRSNVMFEIMRIVHGNGAKFAYPTQTVVVEEKSARPPAGKTD
jgi:MscS family membrane protein